MKTSGIFWVAAVLGAVVLGHATGAQAARAGSASQVCADIVAQYGIAPEGCDPETDAKKAAVSPTATEVVPTVATAGDLPGVIVDSNIFFTRGGVALDEAAQQRLSLLSQILRSAIASQACLRLVGHSDTSGAASVNRDIALRRASVVADFLRASLEDPRRVESVASEGEDSPLAGIPGDDARNRRVTIYARPCPLP